MEQSPIDAIMDVSLVTIDSSVQGTPNPSVRKRINTMKSLHAYTDASVDMTYARNTKIVLASEYVDDYEPTLYDESEMKDISLQVLEI